MTTPFIYEYVHSREFYNETALAKYNNLVSYRTVSTVVNARDGFRENDTSNIPLHFQYEPADCRIYYTPEMAVDMTAAWKTVADSAFNGINHCVAGGFHDTEDVKRGLEKRERDWHRVRRDLDIDVHKRAMADVWTGKDGGGIILGGLDVSYMLP